jgi:rubrerythrin|nr:MAG TPA: DNA-directed RNA polymerase [Caudoviricetes sp.]
MLEGYISREAALKAANEWVNEACMAPVMRVSRLFDKLQKVPAADVAEVVYGQWEGEGDGYADGEIVLDVWHCSQCGYCIDDGTDNPDCLPKYCPGCGAKMDGAAE